MFHITKQYQQNPFPHLVEDNILDYSIAQKIKNEILHLPKNRWDRYSNPFENKYTLRDKNNLPFYTNKLFEFLTSQNFVDHLSTVVGKTLINDPTKLWWGIHIFENGDYLTVHVDAGIHPETKQKKEVTLGIYLSDKWTEQNYGNLELWSGSNSSEDNAVLYKKEKSIAPIFNRLILFTCNDYSWHGAPVPVVSKNGQKRIFLTVSYLAEHSSEKNKRVKAFFVPRPEDNYTQEINRLRMLRVDPEKCKNVYNLKNDKPM